MSRTYRKLPYHEAGLRLPHTIAEMSQLVGVQDELAEASLACNNRVKARVKNIATSYDDIVATSCRQLDWKWKKDR